MNIIKNLVPTTSRAAAIILHNNSILLMKRQKDSKIYYAFPGGKIESGETSKQATIREVFEETSIKVTTKKLLYHLQFIDEPDQNKKKSLYKNEYFYLCQYISGEPVLNENSIEYQKMNENNLFQPMWVKLNEIKNLLLYPLEIRDLLIQDLNSNFNFDTKKIEIVNRRSI